jgi:hypothetical protein
MEMVVEGVGVVDAEALDAEAEDDRVLDADAEDAVVVAEAGDSVL